MHKQSLFHISKRDALPWYQRVLIRGGAILLALIVCALVTMLLTGENPISNYGTIFYGAFFYEQAVPAAEMSALAAIGIPMLCSLAGSLLMGLIYCLLTVTLRANQNVTGLALTTFGVGVGNFFGGSLIKLSGSEVPSIALSATSA